MFLKGSTNMAYGAESISNRLSLISTDEDENSYCVKGVKMLLPETKVPTIAVKVPEMMNEISYWQIGTASVSRVKINGLNPNVNIITEEASTIVGMFSEGYGPVATLGIAVIHIFDIPIQVHVTRSANVAPVVSDGILGYDFLEAANASLNLGSKTMSIEGRRSPVPMLPGKELIPDYLKLLRRRMITSSIEAERGAWTMVSTGLAKLREFLPRKIANEEGTPLLEILEEYVDCFHLPTEKLGFTKLITYSIKSRDSEIICKPQYALPPKDEDEIERQVTELLKQEIIKVSTSPFNSPMRLLEKRPDSKGNVTFRMAADFHELNNRSHGDAFPIPDILDLVDQLHGSRYFSVLDLASAAYQVVLEPEDRKKTAFTTRSGRYEFQRMPIGIKNASQTVQRLMCEVLNDMLAANMVFVCHDDILIHAATIEEHEVRIRKVLSLLRSAELKLQPDKCQLFQPSVMYLGYLVTYEGLRPDPAKIAKLIAEELPRTPHTLSRYLGLLSSFKRFIPDFTSRCKAMCNLLKNKTTVEWTKEAIESFDDLKKDLRKEMLLQYPDWSKPFVLETSASRYGFQAALMQQTSANTRPAPIAYASRSYSPAEAKYDKYDKARVAAMYGMETWYWYFSDAYNKEFTLRTAEPKAFEWYIKRQRHNSEIRGHFELSFSGQKFKIEPLSRR